MVTMAGRPEVVKPGAGQWVLALGCALLLATKFWLIPRLNINWDEFLFLSQIHAAARGELTQGLQTSYTQVFVWMTRLAGDEIAQIHVGRVLMVTLLGASALLIQRLATRWVAPAAGWAAALAFLAMWPTMKHGGTFRADSLLLPLELGALVILTHPGLGLRGRGLGAGALLGAAAAVSIKAILLAPVVVALTFGANGDWRRAVRCAGWMALSALATAVVLVGLHLSTLDGGNPVGASGAMARGAWRGTLRDSPWFPQSGTLQEMLLEDLVFWLVAVAGLGWALWRRLWFISACGLALLPIVFYRNSYAYYYVVMWGPASLLIAAAVAGIRELGSRVARPAFANSAAIALAALLGSQGLRDLPFLGQSRQEAQRQLVAAVHAIFPRPVPYIDHSGMIASFRKANFFMSSWGMTSYASRGRPFMPAAIARFRPPLLISNRSELVPGTRSFSVLHEQDRQLIEETYQPYWGPIRIAGASAAITGTAAAQLRLPFAGRYRLESPQPVRLDGKLLDPGAVITAADSRLVLNVEAEAGGGSPDPLLVRLLWAEAQPPPAEAPISLSYYDGL